LGARRAASFPAPPPPADPFNPPAPEANPFDAPLDAPGAAAPLPVPATPAPAGGDEYVRQQIADAITPVLTELVTELRRSLDFFRNRSAGQGVQRMLIFGGTARLPGLDRFLTANLDTPVVVGNAMENVAVGVRADQQYIQEVAPMFPVSIGLAVRDMLFEAAPPRAKK